MITNNFYKQSGKWYHDHRARYQTKFGIREEGREYELKESEITEKNGEVKKSLYCPKCFINFDPDKLVKAEEAKMDIKKFARPLPHYQPEGKV
jgi:hypothetical protein